MARGLWQLDLGREGRKVVPNRGRSLSENSKHGSDWAPDELDLIVADYFAMLDAEQAGIPYVKAHHRVRLMERIGRTKRSVESKHMNISAVLEELGRPRIKGYVAFPHFQDALVAAVDRFLSRKVAATAGVPEVGVHEEAIPFLEPPPELLPHVPRTAALERLVRKFDPAERDFRNRLLGKEGEAAVLRAEIFRLEQEERPDLARKVRWVSQEDGDGAGFDIHSFDRTGRERLIEVKTTTGGPRTAFYMTRNECSLAEERIDAFKLVRVHSFRREPRMFELEPPLAEHVRLSPYTFEATFS